MIITLKKEEKGRKGRKGSRQSNGKARKESDTQTDQENDGGIRKSKVNLCTILTTYIKNQLYLQITFNTQYK